MRGLELFRKAIALYEDGIKDENLDDDDFSSASSQMKRQKLSMSDILNTKRYTLSLSLDK